MIFNKNINDINLHDCNSYDQLLQCRWVSIHKKEQLDGGGGCCGGGKEQPRRQWVV